MKLLFFRNTHHPDGSYRADVTFGSATVAVHMLDHSTGLTFEELFEQWRAQVRSDNYGIENPEYETPRELFEELVTGLTDTSIRVEVTE